jgi:hypothetical protein
LCPSGTLDGGFRMDQQSILEFFAHRRPPVRRFPL